MGLLPFRYQSPPLAKITPGQKRLIWDSLLDAEMNSRYWRSIARRYHHYDLGLKATVLCISSGAIVSFLGWLQLDWLWKVLMASAACLSAISLALNISGRTEMMMDVAGKWTALLKSYENLWNSLDVLSHDAVLARCKELQSSEVELARAESRLPNIKRLVKKTAAEVCESRGLRRNRK